MKTNGRLVVCDRCGKETFCKLKSDVVVVDNYTRFNKFEDVKGWSYVFFVGDLCPRCTKKYQKFKKGSKPLKYFKSRCLKHGRC